MMWMRYEIWKKVDATRILELKAHAAEPLICYDVSAVVPKTLGTIKLEIL